MSPETNTDDTDSHDNIELLCELSPMQQAMLFHSLLAPGSGVYVVQLALRLTGPLDVIALERAFRHVVARHGILRTAFHWEELEKPLQVVYREVDLAIARESWRELDAAEQRARLERYLDADRERGFELTAAPLMRLALFELEPGVHQLVWTQHHLLVDGWSRGQLLAELFTAYRQLAAGSTPWQERPRGFDAYIAWLQEQDLAEAEAFWRRFLSGFTSPTFVAGGEEKSGPSYRESRRQERALSAETTASLREVARRHRLTLNTLVQGAWALLLARASGSGDVVFGTTVSGRPADLPGVESIVGPFINTQPMRVEVTPERRLAEWLAGLQERQVEMRLFEYAPLVEVQQWSELASGVPLFDHLLVFENLPPQSELSRRVPELQVSEVTANELTNYPLNVVVVPGAELSLTMLYDSGRFDASTISRRVEHLAGLLATFAADPDRAVGELPVLLPAERQQARVEWNDTASAFAWEANVLTLFAAQVAVGPQATAVVGIGANFGRREGPGGVPPPWEGEGWERGEGRRGVAADRNAPLLASPLIQPPPSQGGGTLRPAAAEPKLAPMAVVGEGGEEWNYGRLDEASNRLARHLVRLGVGVGSAVGISLERSPELILGMLAILKAGGAYVPLDAGYPDERLAFMLEDTGAKLALVQASTRDRLAGLAPIVPIEDGAWQAESAAPLAVRVPAASLAYVIYTSGSTGRPKGVAVPHRAIARLVRETNFAQLGPDDRVGHASNISFDAATFEIWGALLNGGAVVVIGKEVALSPAELALKLRAERITTLFLTTALFNQVAREEPAAFRTLRHLLFGGEAVDPGSVARVLAEGAPERLLHVYGPTESTTYATWHRVREVEEGSTVPIGEPLANTTGYVLDAWQGLSALGEVGELYLGGEGLAWGYLNRPELTAERFVPNPWSGEAGERLYRTGDLVRRRFDGAIEFVGRVDHQVKIRGFRIELGEIEADLAALPGVVDCVVLARRDSPGDARLVAYVVPAAGASLDENALRAGLQHALPDYMLPGAFVFLEALPLTPNGKLDRAALPEPGRGGREEGYVAPRDPVEGVLVGIWEEVLGRERVGVEDDFFALGGHSLLATQVMSRMRGAFQVELPLRQLFEGPTIAQLARAVSATRQVEVDTAAPPIVPVPRDRDLPLSFAQQRLWFLDQLEPGNPAYNVPWAARLLTDSGALDVHLLRRIFAAVVRRHEALRTTFSASERGPVQRVQADLPVPIPVISLEGLLQAVQPSEIRRLAVAEARRSFDLSRGPLLRLTLLRLSGREHVLLVTMHHIVSDGWSMGVLLREVMALYAASPLPDLPIQYADFAVWQRAWLSGAVLEAQLSYWREQLAGAPQRLELATDRPRPVSPTHRAGLARLGLDRQVAAALAVFSRSEGVTLYMTLLAALGVLLGRSAHQEEVLVGSPIANRTQRDTEGLIGFFVNTLVLRVDLQAAPSGRELLGRVRQTALDAYAHQDLPFERLVEEVVPERNLGHSPLFQVMFALQNAPVERLAVPGLTLLPLAPEPGVAKFDLTLTFEETPAGLSGLAEYDAEIFDATSIERLLARFTPLLAATMDDAERPIGELPLLLPGEREQLACEWNDTWSDYPRELSVHALFAAQAEATPGALAVVEGEEEWSYGRLAAAAYRLAWHLRSLGVGPESRVGVALERSAELIVAFLGVLAAGGVYVPLDPGYPDERLRFMLEDTGASVVLVHGRTRERLESLSVSASLVCLDRDREAIAKWRATPPPDSTAAEQLAYVIYTSGSTGRPKGVAVAHRAIVRLVRETNFVQLGPEDRVAHASNISFDAATFEIWGALLSGGAVVVIEREVVLSPVALAARLREAGVTAMFLTTALFNQVVREEPGAFYPLRHLLFGGEAADPGAVARALAEGAPERLLHVYGPTESTTYATWHEVREVAPGAATVPIGQPLANTTLYLLVPDLELAPLGQLGELCIGGEGLARGYLNRPELTAERFVPDPWSREPGGRLYRTGDRVRRRGDGAIEFVGRLDQQVKIRGFRIEPGEIEAVLAGCPGVEACVVLARRDTPGTPAMPAMPANTRLVAYLVAKPGERLEEASVREYLQGTLPEYMLPAVYLFLEALPLTPNGKVDRASLPAPEEVERQADGYVAPKGPVERLLVGIWEKVLGRERVGVTDDFFALGGHSLLATQVASRVRQTFGVELPLHELFDRPTIAALAAQLDLLLHGAKRPVAPPLLPLPPELRAPPLALSFAQQRLWFVDQLAPGDPTYNLPWAARLGGDLAVGRLRQVWSELVRRHEALRTTFAESGQGPVQVIAAPRPVPLPVVSLEDLPAVEQDAEVRRLARAEALRTFDLAAGPLLRLTLLGLAARQHVLLVTLHHVVADGWSMGVMQREMALLYGAFSRGEGSPLPELPVQYADFAAWQRGWLAGDVLEEQLAYWRRQLAGAPLRLELPFDRPRPLSPSHRGGLRPARLGGELAQEVAAFSRQEDVTPFMTLLAAFGVLLGRQANQPEVLVGVPIANRTHREIEGLIGFFVNTLVLRVPLGSFGGRPSFRDLLGRVRQVAIDAYAHQDLPFERLVEEVASERGARAPLFQVMFALQNRPGEGAELPGLTLDLLPLEGGVARADLSLMFYESPQGIAGLLEYDADLFDRTSVERLLGRYEGLLRGALVDPERTLWDLPLLLPGEREQVLREWNDTRSEYPRESSVPALFGDQARARPGAPAVLEGDAEQSGTKETWSYGRLDGAANRLAWHLLSLGVGAESPVGVAMERSAELIVALLAILKAGGVYVPLDPGYPDERLRFMLEDSGASVVLVHGRTRERLATLGSPVSLVCLEGDREAIALRSAAAPPALSPNGIAAEQLAYITYTSGSTGRSKGVAVTHRAVVRLVLGTNYLRLGPADRVGHASNINFDAATFEVWGPLLRGAAVVVIEREVVLRPAALAARLRETGVTVLFLTTALFNQVVREEPGAFRSLSHLLFGGEAVDPGAVARALALGAPERLLHLYGPTESTTFAAWHAVREVAPGAATVPIGLPVANTTLYVLDPWGEPAPAGQVGELYIGGEGLARGYLHRPALTAERFVPDPWGGEGGGRLYRTGDRVRRRPDGPIEFVGRLDHQVKIRGFRIEPGEVEAALAGCPGVEACVVLARRDTPGSPRLVAYLVAKPGERLAEGEVREHLKRSLPDYMLPSACLFLPALPLTPNGKLDRAALPAPEAEGAEPGAAVYVAPRGPVETLLVGIWEEILGRERVGVEDDFFALGGHSLLATQLASRIRRAFGVELPLHDLFLRPTIAGLAAELDHRLRQAERDGTAEASRLAIPRTSRDEDLPLSFAQHRLWFIEQLEPGSSAYNMPSAHRASGPLDALALAASFSELVRRHEVLRTVFRPGEKGPVQGIGAPWEVALPRVDLSLLDEPGRGTEALRLIAEEARQPFDLTAGPLLRTILLRLEEEEHVLLVDLHHIAGDGWSAGVLIREVTTLYEAFHQGRPSPLPELAIQYADFAAWQRRWLSGPVLEGEIAWWRERLAGAPPVLDLPTDRPRPPVQSFRGSSQPLRFAIGTAAVVPSFCRRSGVTPFILLLGVFETLLWRYTGEVDLSMGTPIAGRNRLETEGLIGFFVNTLVLRTDLAGDPAFGELLVRLRRVVLDAYSHQDLPFEVLVEALQPKRSLAYEPLFQVMTDFHNLPAAGTAFSGLRWRAIESEQQRVHFDLTLTGEESGGLSGRLEYRTDLFDGTTIRRLAEHLQALLAGVLEDGARRLSELPLLVAGERQQLLAEWHGGARFDVDVLHQRFARQAARLPAELALVSGVEALSYRDLDRRTNRLARRLQRLGVGPEVVVGICLERSPQLVVAMLAVLKAGGAYLPLDPAYPPERLAFMLGDSGARVIVTESRSAGALPAHDLPGATIVELDAAGLEADDAGDAGDAGPVASAVGPENLAYVIYTSGSTGRPRGVLVTHGNVSRLLDATEAWFGFDEKDVWTLFHSYAFDFSVWELWGALAYGGRLVVVPYWVSRSPESFYQLLVEEGVTVLNQTPSAFRQLLPAILAEEAVGVSPDLALRRVIFGGEALDLASLAPWVARHGARRPLLVNMYGITETTVHVTYRPLAEADVRDGVGSLIGEAIPDLTLRLFGPGLALQPIGAPGELCVGGAGLARGYLGRPELTAERFVPDPFGAEPGARLYRSGDLGRRRPDGDVEYLGRIDHQVKVRGFRIELGEIESALAAHPAVRECVVLARQDEPAMSAISAISGDTRLVAYLVPAEAGRLAEGDLREHLKRSLPDYMLPAAYVLLAALPLTPNGKVDRKALPAPEAARGMSTESAESAGYVAPRDPTEEILVGIWQEVLGRERVGVRDDFFALGGHSLLATQVVSRVRGAFQVELPVRRLFEAPTIEALAAGVEAARQGEAGSAPPPIVPVPRDRELPLSFAQQRLWFLDQLAPGNPAYNVPWAVELRGALAVEALARTFAEVARRHEVLRTTFAPSSRGGREAVQVIAPRLLLPLPVVALDGLPASAGRAEAVRLGAGEARRAFDLSAGPLLRLLLLCRSADEHVLRVTAHHIVSDGWSIGVLLREIGVLYGAFRQGEPSPLPALPVQYADFAAWQREWLSGEVLEGQLAYWRQQLAGAPRRLELPTDRPRARVSLHRGGARPTALGEELSREVVAFSRRLGATPFMTLLAAFGLLLGRTAHQEDLLVGTPIANRTQRETEGLIGFFVNTLVLRVALAPGGSRPGFGDLVRQVRQAALGAYGHQDLPFERLVTELDPDRDASRPPLVQVMFALQNAPAERLALPGLTLVPLAQEEGTAKFDLTLAFEESAAGLSGSLEYDAELFDRTTVERLLARFTVLLRGALGSPDLAVQDLPWLFPGEREQLLLEWNDSWSDYPRQAGVPELFAAQAAMRPGAVAVVGQDGEAWSYARLEEASNRLARHLRRRGVEAGDAVGIAMERSPELILGMLAILKAGGAYVPLDAGYPDERLAFMLEDTGASLVLAQATTRERLEGLSRLLQIVPILPIEDAAWQEENGGPLGVPVPAASLAYVIYTSGSTGRPKGVAVPHRAIVRLVRETPFVPLGPADRVAHASNISFDAATFEIWGALLNGGAVVVIPKTLALAPAQLARRLRDERVTTLFLTTALFNQVAEEEPTAFLALRHLLFGGEAVDPGAVARVLAAGPPERLLHVYGPTESTTYAAWHRVSAPAPDVLAAGTVPIGQPLANTTAYLVDSRQQLAALGEIGELCLGGEGLAWGYLHRPELTAERFVPHPWASGPGERLYRTGDLARRRADGAIEFVGRIDHQVKIRGFRIEPGEVEAALAAVPGVRECVVLARRDRPGDARLVAYVVAAEGAGGSEGGLREALRRSLPEYMLPAAYLFLPALPLTPNGKVDRAALPAPEEAAASRGAAYVAPRGPVEEILVGIWQELLGRERVGVTDDFFAAGGHSLLATQVASRIRQTFGVELPLGSLFERTTIAGLAAELAPLLTAVLPAPPPLVAVPREGELPLSFAQQRLWFLDQIDPGNPAYNVAWAAELRGELAVEPLRRTFGEVVRRHEALRTAFPLGPEGPVQAIAPPLALAITLPVVSLAGLPEALRQAEARRLGAAEARHRFDLRTGPLLRRLLLRLAAREHVLLVTVHHIVADGWSVGVLLAEVETLYRAFRQGDLAPAALPELPIQYADFAVWQRQWLAGERLAAQLAYWREQLAGAPLRLELPTDRPRPALQSHRGAALPVGFDPELAQDLTAFSRRSGATLFMTLLAAFGALLGRAAGQEQVLVGTPIANRTHREIEGLIGFFVNTLVLQVDLSGAPSFQALLGRVRTMALGAFTHQDLPFDRLVEALEPERDTSRSPLFQAMLTLQNAAGGGLALPGLEIRPVEIPAATSKFDLTLGLTVGEGRIAGGVEYSTALFDRTTIERTVERLAILLREVVRAADRPLADLPLLSLPESQQLLLDWNDTRALYPDATLHALVERQAAARPEAVAVVAADRCLTYGELCRRAHRLARRLRALGVGPEVPVGLLLERSPELVVGLLGILQAGGAYVPLDPDYPELRLGLIVEDSGMPVVVTDSRLAGRVSGRGVETVLMDLDTADPGERRPESAISASATGLAYVLYTSGSTGTPKGVMIPHRGVVNYLAWCCEPYGLGPGRRSLLHSSIGFDLTVTALWGPLVTGGEVHLLAEGDSWGGMVAALERAPVQLLKLTPAHLEVLRRELPAAAARQVGVLVLGGEALSGDALEPWRTAAPATRVVNEYGPTEATVGCAVEIAPAGAIGSGQVPIGRPIANARLHVLSAELILLPTGSRGELAIGGDGLARGYLGRPDLTAERFVPDPYAAVPGERLYRTGDLVRRLPGGALDFLGRVDFQVKIRGVRIELGEIESALLRHPGVRETVVVVREDLPGEKALVAYLVAAGVPPPATGELRAFLRERLPAALLPAAFVLLEALPLTANGKLDRRALPAPGRSRPELERAYTAPRDALELQLARLWEGVLGVRPVGITDDFFALGGHSLLAVQLMARIEHSLGAHLPMATLLRHATIERLAAVLREQVGPVRRQALVEIEPGSGRPFFCVHPVGGDVLCYVHLARHLAGERGIYGLQVPDDEAGPAPRTLEEMAAGYLRAIRQVQPAGPYSLGGWSMGGVVAFEIARQLEAAGESVDLLALVDSLAPDLSPDLASDGMERPEGLAGGALVALFAADLARLLRLDGLALPPGFAALETAEALAWLAAQAARTGLLPAGAERAEITRRFAIFAANHQALERYRGGVCAVPLVLFRATERPAGLRLAADLGWGRWTERPIEVHEIAGDHYALLAEPQVRTLAAALHARLAGHEYALPEHGEMKGKPSR